MCYTDLSRFEMFIVLAQRACKREINACNMRIIKQITRAILCKIIILIRYSYIVCVIIGTIQSLYDNF